MALRKKLYSVVPYYAYIYVVYFYFWILFLQMSSFQIYIMLQDIYKAYYKLLELQYLDDTPKTCGSERVASIFTLAVFGTPQKKLWQWTC